MWCVVVVDAVVVVVVALHCFDLPRLLDLLLNVADEAKRLLND